MVIKIIFTVFNAPRSTRDSTLAHWGKLYDLLDYTYKKNGGKCVMDSAFAVKNNPAVIRSADYTKAKSSLELLVLREATSLQQAAEWGMGALQSGFPRITDTIRWEDYGKRALLLECMIFLYNYRVETVGLNQIRTVYMPCLERNFEEVPHKF